MQATCGPEKKTLILNFLPFKSWKYGQQENDVLRIESTLEDQKEDGRNDERYSVKNTH